MCLDIARNTFIKSTMNDSARNGTQLTASDLSQQFFRNILPVTVFIGGEICVGLVGNLLILYIYYRFYRVSNFRYLVLSLAIYDLTSCLTTLPGEIYAHHNWYNYMYDWLCKVKSYFNVFTAWGAAFTLLVLTVDRFRKVCCPLSWQLQSSVVRKLCISGIVISHLVSVPILFLWGEQTYTRNGVNVSICEKAGQYASGNYPFIYITCVYSAPIGFMMVVIVICNIMLARQLFCRMLDNKANDCYSMRRRTFESSINSDDQNSEAGGDTVAPSLNHSRHTAMVPSDEDNSSNSLSKSKSFSSQDISVQSSESLNEYQKPGKGQYNIENVVPVFVIDMHFKSERSACSERDGICVHRKESKPLETIRRRARKTWIMLILTTVYILTTTSYIALVARIAGNDGILRGLSNREKVVYFFFLRLYFINSAINPIIYGIMDPRFRNNIKKMLARARKQKDNP